MRWPLHCPRRCAQASFLVAATAVPAKNAAQGTWTRLWPREADVELSELAITIIKYRKVVLPEDCGVRKLGHPTPVEENVLFGMGLNTKAFTAAALAALVASGEGF